MTRPAGRAVVRTTMDVLVAWILGTGVWLVTLSSVTPSEIALAVSAGLLGGLATARAQHLLGLQWVRPRHFGPAMLRLPFAVVVESGRVLVRALRPGAWHSRLHTVAFPAGTGHDDSATAASILMVSTTPSTVVVDVLEDGLLVHELPGVQAPGWLAVQLPAPSATPGDERDR